MNSAHGFTEGSDEGPKVSIPTRSLVQYLREYHNDLRDKAAEYSEDASKDIHLNNSMFFRGKAEAYAHAAKKLNDIFQWLDIKP